MMNRRRAGNSTGGIYIIFLLVCVVVVVLTLVIFDGSGEHEAKQPENQVSGAVTPPADALPSPTPTPTPTPAATPVPVNGAPDLKAMQAADDDFFTDSVFIGNSLIDGLYLYGGVSTCDYLSGTGMSINNVRTQKISDKRGGQCTVMEALNAKQYLRIYILLGINEIGSDAAAFAKDYASLADDIRALQPSADIYVMSLTPVSAYKSSHSPYFTKTRVLEFNSELHQICADKGLWYLDDFTPLADKDGFLPSDVTEDGVHFKPSYYSTWMDVIRTHYVERT